MPYFTGKGYGVSNITDLSDRPLLTFQGPNDKKPFLLSDRVAQGFDFTIAQVLTPGQMKNARLDGVISSYIKTQLGGGPDDELDHKISLELGGSNAPSNLWIQVGMTSGASAASDTLENVLALDVVAGRISLLTAWRTLAEQKGFLLGEDTKIGTIFSISQVASALYGIAAQTLTGQKGAAMVKQSTLLQNQMAADVEKLKQYPLDQKLQTKIFADNVQNLTSTLAVNSADAGAVTKSFLGSYAQSKGVDPREIMGALNANIQQIVTNSGKSPNIFGVPTPVIINIVGVLQSVSTVSVAAGVGLAIIGIFLAGPEAILAALSGGLLESIGAIFGVSTLTGIGLTMFAFGEAMTVASIGLGMTIKQTYDNSYLLPTQQISALKDALAVQKGLAGFLPSAVSTSPSSPVVSSSSGAGGASGPHPVLYIGHVDRGNLKPVTPFAPIEAHSIASGDDLENAARQNIAAFLSALPGLISYQIKTKMVVLQPDGTEVIGNVTRAQKGVTKKGAPTFHNVANKFAVVEVMARSSAGKLVLLDEIILGQLDSARFTPSVQDMGALGNLLTAQLVTTDISTVHTVTTNPQAAAAASDQASPNAIRAVQQATDTVAAALANPSPAALAAAAAAVQAAAALIPPVAPVPQTTPAAPPPVTSTQTTPAPVTVAPAPAPVTVAPARNTGPVADYLYSLGYDGSVAAIDTLKKNFGESTDAGLLAAMQSFYKSNGSIYSAVKLTAPAPVTVAPAPVTPPGTMPGFPRMVTVNVATLNVRAAPNTSAALAGSLQLFAGNQFAVTGFVTGENVSGESRWWVSSLGHYVWIGGTLEKP